MKTIIQIVLFSTAIVAQSHADYYPLHIGNKWFYKFTRYDIGSTPSSTYYYSKEVIGDTLMSNGIKYYTILEDGRKHYERFDSTTNEIKYYELNGCSGVDVAKYSLNHEKDSITTWNSCDYMTYKITYQKLATSDTSFIYLNGDGLVVEFVSFKRYVGIASRSITEGGYSINLLIGHVIDGKKWGHLTNIDNHSEVPFNYSLEQNYPNPFNPETTIEFSLKMTSHVRLNIYNSLGKLIDTLLDKELIGGQHKIVFNGSNYVSGVYFYQIVIKNYSSTNKFLLLK